MPNFLQITQQQHPGCHEQGSTDDGGLRLIVETSKTIAAGPLLGASNHRLRLLRVSTMHGCATVKQQWTSAERVDLSQMVKECVEFN